MTGTNSVGYRVCVCVLDSIKYWQVMVPALPDWSAKTNRSPVKEKAKSPPVNLQMTAVGAVLASPHLLSTKPNETDMLGFIFLDSRLSNFAGSDKCCALSGYTLRGEIIVGGELQHGRMGGSWELVQNTDHWCYHACCLVNRTTVSIVDIAVVVHEFSSSLSVAIVAYLFFHLSRPQRSAFMNKLEGGKGRSIKSSCWNSSNGSGHSE